MGPRGRTRENWLREALFPLALTSGELRQTSEESIEMVRKHGYSLLQQQDSASDEREEEPLEEDVMGPTEEELDAHLGVRTVEAVEKIYGKHSKRWLFLGIALASYIYSLDSTTAYTYFAYATSTFGEHSLISSILVAQSMIIAVGKPVIAKLADVTSRAIAYLTVLIFYAGGYMVIAMASNIGTIAAGLIIYAVGYTGLQLLTSVIIADITTLKWRGLVSGLTSAPFIINAFIGANISSVVLKHLGWRWGYVMFAILVPLALSPLIITLIWAERKAKRLGLVPTISSSFDDRTFLQRAWHIAEQLDIIGLVLLGGAITLVLLPLTLSQTSTNGWRNPYIGSMFLLGWLLLGAFIFWDTKYATNPVMPARFLRNRSFLAASWIGFFDFLSFYLTNTFLYSFVLVVKPWSLTNVTYFTSIQMVSMTVFAIFAGIYMRITQRYKWLLVTGLCIRSIGVALMIRSRGAKASDVEIVMTQILQGIGGGIASSCSGVGSQASVPHADVAIVISVVLLFTEIGGAAGNALAGGIWNNLMPTKLADHLPQLSVEDRAKLFGSINHVISYPRGHPIREGVIEAYDDTMRVLVLCAAAMSIVPILFSLIMPNWYLGDGQNAVDDTGLTGERSPLRVRSESRQRHD